ncbi:hypothetical protein GCM10009564_15590 [Streptomyces thermogriseus]|jgi:hypothetical protein|uniref:Uncharacterized protein n=1 Tax=Streptomyces thermogriseus TaxID=75292 RepID=A0ABN1SVT5_9ACTN
MDRVEAARDRVLGWVRALEAIDAALTLRGHRTGLFFRAPPWAAPAPSPPVSSLVSSMRRQAARPGGRPGAAVPGFAVRCFSGRQWGSRVG